MIVTNAKGQRFRLVRTTVTKGSGKKQEIVYFTRVRDGGELPPDVLPENPRTTRVGRINPQLLAKAAQKVGFSQDEVMKMLPALTSQMGTEESTAFTKSLLDAYEANAE